MGLQETREWLAEFKRQQQPEDRNAKWRREGLEMAERERKADEERHRQEDLHRQQVQAPAWDRSHQQLQERTEEQIEAKLQVLRDAVGDCLGEIRAQLREEFQKALDELRADFTGKLNLALAGLEARLVKNLEETQQVVVVLEWQLSDIQRDVAHANDTAAQLRDMELRLDARREADEARRGLDSALPGELPVAKAFEPGAVHYAARLSRMMARPIRRCATPGATSVMLTGPVSRAPAVPVAMVLA